MLAHQRHDLIVEIVRREGTIRVRDLADQLDVSAMTVFDVKQTRQREGTELIAERAHRAFIESARRVVVLADHTKWATRGLAQIAPLDRVDLVISDDALPTEARKTFENLGVDVALVTPRRMSQELAWGR